MGTSSKDFPMTFRRLSEDFSAWWLRHLLLRQWSCLQAASPQPPRPGDVSASHGRTGRKRDGNVMEIWKRVTGVGNEAGTVSKLQGYRTKLHLQMRGCSGSHSVILLRRIPCLGCCNFANASKHGVYFQWLRYMIWYIYLFEWVTGLQLVIVCFLLIHKSLPEA